MLGRVPSNSLSLGLSTRERQRSARHAHGAFGGRRKGLNRMEHVVVTGEEPLDAIVARQILDIDVGPFIPDGAVGTESLDMPRQTVGIQSGINR
jgi:hypothetical protein